MRLALLFLLAACAPERCGIRPFAEIDAMAHDGLGQNSRVAAGVTFIDPETGCRVSFGPAARFDLGGEGNILNDAVAGAAFRLDFVR